MLNDKHIDLLKDKHKVSYLLFKKGKPIEAFSSHQPLLIHTLNTITEGKVLEFGMGHNSTPLMSIICGMQGRELLSVETDEEWYNKFKGYKKQVHEIQLIPYKISKNRIPAPVQDPSKLIEYIISKGKYSVAFVDGAPAEFRQPVVVALKDVADYIIVHDTECVWQGLTNCYAYDFSMFKHIHHFKTSPPTTCLLSNLKEINSELLSIFPS
jgi:hypothetical protein